MKRFVVLFAMALLAIPAIASADFYGGTNNFGSVSFTYMADTGTQDKNGNEVYKQAVLKIPLKDSGYVGPVSTGNYNMSAMWDDGAGNGTVALSAQIAPTDGSFPTLDINAALLGNYGAKSYTGECAIYDDASGDILGVGTVTVSVTYAKDPNDSSSTIAKTISVTVKDMMLPMDFMDPNGNDTTALFNASVTALKLTSDAFLQ